MDDTFRRRALSFTHLDAKLSVVSVAESGPPTVVERRALEVLGDCARFRTLDAHADCIATGRKLPPTELASIRKLLAQLAERGLLISKSALIERAREAPTRGPASATIDTVCTVTRDRPRAVERCIRSYAANMRSHGRAVGWTVLDSSPDRDTRRHCREILRAVAREGIHILYAGPEDKEVFGAALAAEADIDPDLVRFALFDTECMGHDTGANRNALLLAHAGQLLLSVDDDTVCDIGYSPTCSLSQIELASFHRPPVVHFDTADSAYRTLIPARESILAAHEELLGRPVEACLGGHREEEVIADALSDETLEIILGCRARVGATVGAFWGDCATTSPAYYLFCEGPHPDSLPRDETAYRELVSSRQVLRASTRPTLSAGAIVMAANLGLDLRELVPPFFPMRRAQDLIFGALLRRCFEDRFVGFVPLAVGHLPAETRRANPDALWGTAKPKLAVLIFHAIHAAPLDVANVGAPRLRLLGRHLRELSLLPWPEVERILMRRVREAMARELSAVQERLGVADRSSPWARDARNYREALLARLQSTDLTLPESVRENRTADDACMLMRRLMGRFGALLEAWPELFAAAKRLRANGIPFGSAA